MTGYCSPCTFNYDFIAKQENAAEDYPQILKITGYQRKYPKLHIPNRFHSSLDVSKLTEPYGNLSRTVIEHVYKNYFVDFVMYNYSIFSVLEAAKGIDDQKIIRAREVVKDLLNQTMEINRYTYKAVCEPSENQKYEWKLLENCYLRRRFVRPTGLVKK